MRRLPSRLIIGFALGLAPFVPAAPASAEIHLAPGVVVLTPEDVLDRYITHRDGVDWVEIDGYDAWELTAVDHPTFGSYVPVDTDHVSAAWRAVDRTFRSRVELTIVCLPRPRAALPNSSAEDRIIYLSPGARSYDREQVAFLVAHEMGHVVHRDFLPEPDSMGWRAYREIRSIEDETRYHDWAPHADRPREIFAEDFRFLFGGALANYSGSIENADLPLPDTVPGLEAFMLGLAGESTEATSTNGWDVAALHVTPQPSRGHVTLMHDPAVGSASSARALVIVDATGRLVARLQPSESGAGRLLFHWDGKAEGGRAAGTGVYYASLRGHGPRAVGRVIMLP